MTTHELILPEPRNEYARGIHPLMDRVLRIAPPDIQVSHAKCQQLATAIMVAANEITTECSPGSVKMGAFHAAHVGLAPGSALGLAYFIPRKRKKTDRLARCNLEIGYKGFLALSYTTNFLKDVHAEVVLAGEEFKYWVDENGPRLLHDIPDPLNRPTGTTEIRAAMRGAYCLYHTQSGGTGLRWINRKQLDVCDSGYNVWASHYQEMCRKSAIRRAAKDWNLVNNVQLAHAITLDEQAERGDIQSIGMTVPEETTATANTGLLDLDEM